MKPNRPELALFRGKDSDQNLAILIESFAQGDDARRRRYANAFRNFTGVDTGEQQNYFGSLSLSTRKAYSSAIEEFFEWVARSYSRIVPPHEVTRDMATQYVDWLANRPFSLVEEKLQDGDRSEDFAIYKIVEELGESKLQDIYDRLPSRVLNRFGDEDTRNAVAKRLGELCRTWVLRRSPTMEELRKINPQAGITVRVIEINGMEMPIEEIYIYRVHSADPLKRTTILTRLAALSALWNALMLSENQDDPRSDFIRFDIWKPLMRRVSRGSEQEKKQATREGRLPPQLVFQMLREAPMGNVLQLRDRAIIYLLALLGLRKSELQGIRRSLVPGMEKRVSYFQGGEPPKLSVLRKGSRRQVLPYPPAALEALIAFQTKLGEQIRAATKALQAGAFKTVPEERQLRFLVQLAEPEAPLFPPLGFWGKNSVQQTPKPLTSRAIDASLKRVARDAGLTEEQINKVHAHAFRHFAASAMLNGGKDLRSVQYILGHESITTTEKYLSDVDDMVELSGQDAILNYARQVSADQILSTPTTAPAPAPEPSTTPVVDTIVTEGIEAPTTPREEVVLEQLNLSYEPPPQHQVPIAPEPEIPEAIMRRADDGEHLVETQDGLIGLDGDPVPITSLDDPTDDKSPGTPDYVYEMYARKAGATKNTTGPEVVAFTQNRSTGDSISLAIGKEKPFYQGNEFLREHYDPWPADFGIGTQSLLPWFTRGGTPNDSGYVKGVPPLPVWSPAQAIPETVTRRLGVKHTNRFVDEIHEMHEEFLIKSPTRAVGLLRWYQFFIYHAAKLDQYLSTKSLEGGHVPTWSTFDGVVEVGEVRSHKDEWLLKWLKQNSHTYKVVRKFLRTGLSDFDSDVFWRQTFEGVDLVTDLPEWLAYDDPLKPIAEDSEEWERFTTWLLNATGQRLSARREEERKGQKGIETAKQQEIADKVRECLLEYYKNLDAWSELMKAISSKKQSESDTINQKNQYIDNMKLFLSIYAYNASSKVLPSPDIKDVSKYNAEMSKILNEHNVPDPNSIRYREIKTRKDRISLIVNDLFPETPGLADPNYFKASKLFDPRYFRLDEEARTVFIDPEIQAEVENTYKQDANLLVRRAIRAMWDWVRERPEERGQNSEMKSIMLAYLSTIVPPGKSMEDDVKMTRGGRGLPLREDYRQAWLKSFEETIRDLAVGSLAQRVASAVKDKNLDSDEAKAEKSRVLRVSEDMLNRATSAVDILMVHSAAEEEVVDDPALASQMLTPEQLLERREEEEGLGRTPPAIGVVRRRLVRNATRRAEYIYVEGEQPQVWFKADLSSARSYTRNPSTLKYLSLGSIKRVQDLLMPARGLLPTPFEMLRAMASMP
jgi:integrase